MGFNVSTNQREVPAGKLRYNFDLTIQGKRHRKNVICMKSVVASMHREWELAILAEHQKPAEEFISLFETLNQYLEFVKGHKRKEGFRHESMVINTFKEYIGIDMNLLEFRRHHAEDFIQWRRTRIVVQFENTKTRGQLSNSTINRNIAVLSYFFNWCIRRELFPRHNPFSMTKLPERNYREVMLTGDQMEELLMKAEKIGYMFHTAISILLLTGMRRGELFSLEWSEVNFDTRFIILSQYKTKSRKRRAITISPVLREILLTLKNSGSDIKVMGKYTVNQLAKEWQKLLFRISFSTINDGTDFRIHDLRHVYSQSLLNMGVSLEDIQSLLGHQDFSTTQRRYAQFARPDLLDKGSMIDNVVKIKHVI